MRAVPLGLVGGIVGALLILGGYLVVQSRWAPAPRPTVAAIANRVPSGAPTPNPTLEALYQEQERQRQQRAAATREVLRVRGCDTLERYYRDKGRTFNRDQPRRYTEAELGQMYGYGQGGPLGAYGLCDREGYARSVGWLLCPVRCSSRSWPSWRLAAAPRRLHRPRPRCKPRSKWLRPRAAAPRR